MSGPPAGTRLGSTTHFTGRVFRLDTDEVRYPDGSTGRVDVVRHPGASAILPFLSDPAGDDPQVLLLRQFRWPANAVLYEIPAGRLDVGEDPAAAAARELREETGMSAGRLDHLYSCWTTPGFTDERLDVYLATDLRAATTDGRDEDEIIEVEAMPLSDALAKVRDGTIRDMKTIAALLYAAGFVCGR